MHGAFLGCGGATRRQNFLVVRSCDHVIDGSFLDGRSKHTLYASRSDKWRDLHIEGTLKCSNDIVVDVLG